jgi:hypothetical protein
VPTARLFAMFDSDDGDDCVDGNPRMRLKENCGQILRVATRLGLDKMCV